MSSEHLIYTTCFHPVTARCPATCECPAQALVCPPGVSTVSDGCGCCKVCAAQLNQDCSSTRPCDHHKGLECNYGNDVTTAWGICRAKSEGRSCEYNSRIYQNGESFRASCKHQCTCIDGAVGCAPLCNNKLPPVSPSCPYPRLVRTPGQCCFTVDCHKGTWRLPPEHEVCVFFLLRSHLREKTCPVQTSEWSQCSRTCGVGISSRITNKNPQCKLVRETRICTIRPCHAVPHTAKPKKERKCYPTLKAPEPLRLSYGECKSARLYRPNYCGTCSDGRCCSSRRTRTIPVTFVCPDGERFQRSAMFIQSCKCSNDCGLLNEVALPPQHWMYGDTHKFID
ncbi:hypothetical protein Q5P01_025043 [Channa striata]|uniref:Connective tissue growth factor n=1 Tax=Channa striata TaxID=64152 RepID=A0AA88IHZ4_CHASR|nr:hypothetical protein Q5P01_025043 [Channa striata]